MATMVWRAGHHLSVDQKVEIAYKLCSPFERALWRPSKRSGAMARVGIARSMRQRLAAS